MAQSLNRESSNSVTDAKGWFPQLKVNQKISLSYALALTIAVVGTGIGMIIGQRNQNLAKEFETQAQEEIDLLSDLQINLLQIRTHQQQLAALVGQPQQFQIQYRTLQKLIAKNSEIWSEIVRFAQEDYDYDSPYSNSQETRNITTLITESQAISEKYTQRLSTLIAPIERQLPQTPAEIAAVQTQLLAFSKGNPAQEWDRISEHLSEMLDYANAEELQAEASAKKALQLQIQIIIASMLLSVAIAIILSIYLSSVITKPLQQATNIARKVTKESDFNLQIPITTKDEIGVLATDLNRLISKVRQLLDEQKAASAQKLLESEKMSSLGRMLAGVAHEINNPVNFMYGNLIHATGYIDDLFDLIDTYQQEIPNPPEAITDKIDEIELDFLKEDLPKLIQSMQIGADRTRQIVLSLRNFSRIDETEPHPVDLHECIDSTLLILHNRIKKGVEVVKNYGKLPQINGYAGSLYQVFTNLLSNALDALEENPPLSPLITITTSYDQEKKAIIKIADNGSGIEPQNLNKIFDTFFTTKAAGVGTGLGLAITYQIITEKHSGTINCQSEVGKGTEFIITLPLTP